MLKVPQVTTSKNDASTFKPYNPAEATGPTSPSTPYIAPPPPGPTCTTLAMIIMVAIAVVVTVYTAGAASGLMSSTVSAWSAGLSALGGSSLGAAFVGGVAGSIASQVVGKAMGVVDHFSLKDAVVGGLTTMAGAGIGKYLKGVDALTKGAKTAGELNHIGRVVQGVAGYGSSVISNAVVGQAPHFSWTGVAAAAVGSGISSLAGGTIPTLSGGTSAGFANDLIGGLINGAANATAQRVFGMGKQDWSQIGADAFGNALGNAAVRGIQFQSELKNLTPEQRRAYDIDVDLGDSKSKALMNAQQLDQIRATTAALFPDRPNSDFNTTKIPGFLGAGGSTAAILRTPGESKAPREKQESHPLLGSGKISTVQERWLQETSRLEYVQPEIARKAMAEANAQLLSAGAFKVYETQAEAEDAWGAAVDPVEIALDVEIASLIYQGPGGFAIGLPYSSGEYGQVQNLWESTNFRGLKQVGFIHTHPHNGHFSGENAMISPGFGEPRLTEAFAKDRDPGSNADGDLTAAYKLGIDAAVVSDGRIHRWDYQAVMSAFNAAMKTPTPYDDYIRFGDFVTPKHIDPLAPPKPAESIDRKTR